MHQNNSKVVTSIAANLVSNRASPNPSEFHRNNLIFLRKPTDFNHILFRTPPKTTVCRRENEINKSHFFFQQSEKKGYFVQSVKKLNSPILFLRGDKTSEHILVHSSSEDKNKSEKIEDISENILIRALEGIRNIESDSGKGILTTLRSDGDPIKLPENLESLPRADHFSIQRHRWNTNEEIAAILISFDRHSEWQSKEVKIRPKSGSMLLYSRKKVRYRRDGYCWKKRKDGKTTREDHMKLKVQGTECIYGCYVHSAILPTFHRRCYWLLQNPDIVLVHYLNVPYPDDNKLAVITPNLALWADKKEWTKEELVSQLKPMFFSEDEPDLNNDLEITTAETVEAIVTQLMEKQKLVRQTAVIKQFECTCPDSTCADSKSCSHFIRRIVNPKAVANSLLLKSSSCSNLDNNQVSSTTGPGSTIINDTFHRIYSRDFRTHESQISNCSSTTSSLVLSLSQFQNNGRLLILNNNSKNCSEHRNAICRASTVNMSNSYDIAKEIRSSQLTQKQQLQESCGTLTTTTKIDLNLKIESGENLRQSVYRKSICSNVDSRDRKQKTTAIVLKTQSLPSNQSTNANSSKDTTILKNICNSSDKNKKTNKLFNETLDLSQDDLQRTLSANMPQCSTEMDNHDQHSGPNKSNDTSEPDQNKRDDVNAIDVIHNCEVADNQTPVDDVFVNLEAFDILGEFPELVENSESNREGIVNINPSDINNKQQLEPPQSNNLVHGLAIISDYSPDWSYPQGGVKVLVTGPWNSTGSYSVLFDAVSVPTTFVQNGVLRCYCPAHESGLATIQVANNGYVISNSVIFEYKLPQSGEKSIVKSEKYNDNLLKFSLLQRLEALDQRLEVKEEQLYKIEDAALLSQPKFEERLVNFSQKMMTRVWRCEQGLSVPWRSTYKGMKLLHLAASLGYSKLIGVMFHWRTENSSFLLETEVDALSQDDDGFTPLMWACVKGHMETAILLYKWNHRAVNIKNTKNQSAIDCARLNNHPELVKQLENFELKKNREEFSLQSIQSLKNRKSTSPSSISPASSSSSINSVTSTNNTLEAIYINLGDITGNEHKLQALNIDFGTTNYEKDLSENSVLDLSSNSIIDKEYIHRRLSIDSGIHMGYDLNADKESTTNSFSEDMEESLRYDRSKSISVTEKDGNCVNSSIVTTDSSNATDKEKKSECETQVINTPLIDMETVTDDESDISKGNADARVLTLAEQIIEALPERIKNEKKDVALTKSSTTTDSLHGTLLSVLMEPIFNSSSSKVETVELNFHISDNTYRNSKVITPCPSPTSSTCLHSPSSLTVDSPTSPPTTADFCEFFQASKNFERDFSNLTLSDREQRELYEAAKIIQKAYRSYKGRQQQEQDKERAAAIVIQNYYRRYKQYVCFRQMTHAASVIQSQFRRYYVYKKFKKSQKAAIRIQNYYRNYKEHGGKNRRKETKTYMTCRIEPGS